MNANNAFGGLGVFVGLKKLEIPDSAWCGWNVCGEEFTTVRRVLVVHNPNHNPKLHAAILRQTLARTDQNEFN